ncbi:MAG TPA: dethiobiotin synthase [Acidiphilium sp.]
MSAFFVTATGTEIGKTHVTASMIRVWRAAGLKARALKPVMSGYQPAMSAASDAGVLLRAMGAQVSDADVGRISPWRFPDPISPDMAAARMGRTIPFGELIAFCRGEIAQAEAPLLIEGIGGAMVPLDDCHTVRDWIAELAIPAVVVTGAYLGTLSHTLCTVEALRARGVSIAAIVVNEIVPGPVPVEETRAAIARHIADPAIDTVISGAEGWLDRAVTPGGGRSAPV